MTRATEPTPSTVTYSDDATWAAGKLLRALARMAAGGLSSKDQIDAMALMVGHRTYLDKDRTEWDMLVESERGRL